MTKPDYVLISEVMLFSQGFRTAEVLSEKIVPLFKLCGEQLSAQSHYDFALRALKSVLVCSGVVKRSRIQKIKEKMSMDDAARYIQRRWDWFQTEGKFLAKKGKKGRKGKKKKKK